MKWYFWLILAAALAGGMALGSFLDSIHWRDKLSDKVIESIECQSTEALSDWEVLELAIMKTESDFNTNARGTRGDLGLFQITEIYVEEVNRLLGEPTYVHTDAFVPERALEMFTIYQDNHNPKHDYIRAINAHNPGGESIGYSQKVLANMEWIKRYEKIKTEVQNFNRR